MSGNRSSSSRPSVPLLLNQITFGAPEARSAAMRALESVGPEDAEATDSLVKALAGHRADVRRTAAMALGCIGPRASPAAAALVQLLQSPDAALRSTATDALGRI